MFELILCSLFTLLPDYLFRRYVQGKRFGREITFFSVWYELRWGIVSCLMLTIGLITLVFYFHPATTNVTALFRTVPILPETNGRVGEIFVTVSDEVKQGQAIGTVGDTGSLQGPRLYFEVRHAGKPQDPGQWLRPRG